eukprot:gb/GEZN01011288.1/.p1 GENE.gb/GEZN01011288.1/~~gb/GEZN01011288.1/.p1  ORF type:complete len:318 (-),score=42.29 gb/GEZN01011288.1/:217-1128(-)
MRSLWIILAAACMANDLCDRVGWDLSRCLGTSGRPASAAPLTNKQDASIVWEGGMQGHSHYPLTPSETAVFVIDPQNVYSACPEELIPERLLVIGEGITSSPLCCEKFYPAVENINNIAAAARQAGSPVFLVNHIYRDLDGDGEVDQQGRIPDFDVLGWAGWPKAFNLWSEQFPWHKPELFPENPRGFKADKNKDYYCEKTIYSAITEPVMAKLRALNINTIIVTGFMTQYCAVTTTRHAHDLGFRVVYAQDACDGPKLLELLSGVDENHIVPFYLGISVADVTTTADIVARLSRLTAGKAEL